MTTDDALDGYGMFIGWGFNMFIKSGSKLADAVSRKIGKKIEDKIGSRKIKFYDELPDGSLQIKETSFDKEYAEAKVYLNQKEYLNLYLQKLLKEERVASEKDFVRNQKEAESKIILGDVHNA